MVAFTSQYHVPLYEKLRENGLVSDDLDAVLSTLPRIIRKCQEIFTLNDTFKFVVDFSSQDLYFNVITEQKIETLQFVRPFVELRPTIRTPYTDAYTNHHLSIRF